MGKLRYKLNGNFGVEWQAIEYDGKEIGPWRRQQWEAYKDLEKFEKTKTTNSIHFPDERSL